ncbi:MAG: hypothetical protein NZM07_11930, partial [Elioraea sp.]|nr:hypothetical protein [Elioraea sp.]
QWLVQLVARFGVRLVQVTFDSFQSVESQQALRRQGIVSGQLSVDRQPEPYLYLRRCFDEGRLLVPAHDLLFEELSRLEWDERKRKVDHPPRGSKDLADALCGAVWGLAQRREIRLAAPLPASTSQRPRKPRPLGRLRR